MSIEEEIIREIKPTDKEIMRIHQVADSLMLEVNEYIDKNGIQAKPMLVGSFAKGTFLADPDLDLFLLFPETSNDEEISAIALKMGEELINGQRLYAEHPYSSGRYKGIDVDMVPCYDIATTEKLISAVDRSPFHYRYIISKADEKMCDEIRLLKKFMKGIGAYGAEPNVRGFSGYLCELLTIHYGGFIPVLEAASKWKEGTTIVMEGKGPSIKAPLVLYDPVDSKRNVASAVHIDTLCLFIEASRRYLKDPSRSFFFPGRRIPLEKNDILDKIESRGTRLFTVVFKRPNIIEDNLYSQIWRTQYAIEKKLNSFSFGVVRSGHKMNNGTITILFELEQDTISRTHKHIGPPVWVKQSESFLEKWENNVYGSPFIEDGHWAVVADRLYNTAADMVRKEMALAGIGKDFDIESMVLYGHDDSLSKTDSLLISELLDPKFRWEL